MATVEILWNENIFDFHVQENLMSFKPTESLTRRKFVQIIWGAVKRNCYEIDLKMRIKSFQSDLIWINWN